jgi:hypothetical protein
MRHVQIHFVLSFATSKERNMPNGNETENKHSQGEEYEEIREQVCRMMSCDVDLSVVDSYTNVFGCIQRIDIYLSPT